MEAPSVGMALHHSVPGVIEMPAQPHVLVLMHVGTSVRAVCQRGGVTFRGLEVHGGFDIIPAHMAARWHIDDPGTTLVVDVPVSILESAAVGSGRDPADILLLNGFQRRDPQIERLSWALRTEIEAGEPAGRLFRDSLGLALAAQLLHRHSERPQARPVMTTGGIRPDRLRRVLAYIEDHLDADLSLAALAIIADTSASHLKVVFRQATGVAVHQYVITRRVERARTLLRDGRLPIGEVALAAGFAHQSHLARHMRRLLGVSPSAVRRGVTDEIY